MPTRSCLANNGRIAVLINADFNRPVVMAPAQYPWVASPQRGVERVMLDRLGGESTRATSIVRYAPRSHFPPHRHDGGEEILVLSGTFSEADRHYGAGWYLRNPPGSSHQPSSSTGAIIFVKLRQMTMPEDTTVRIDTRDPYQWRQQPDRAICPLFEDEYEQVSLHRLKPGKAMFIAPVDGAELLVLAGDMIVDALPYMRGSWLRLPAGHYPRIVAGARGATVYSKTGPLGRTAAEDAHHA